MRLEKPSMEWKEEHEAFIEEWGTDVIVPYSLDLTRYDNNTDAFYAEFEDEMKGRNGWVPNESYFLVDEQDRIVAGINIRLELTDFLRNVGGHIGYGVRPSERRKGYAKQILHEALQVCSDRGLTDVLVTCDKENIGSAKTILANGGVEEEPFTEEDGTVKRRFWIKL